MVYAMIELETKFGQKNRVKSLDTVMDILSNSRRRAVVRTLEGRDESMALSELAELLAKGENGTEQIDSSERKRVYIALHQCHLPRMDEYNVLDYNKDRKTLEIDEGFDDVSRTLKKVDSLYS